jgi:hypothetical protein
VDGTAYPLVTGDGHAAPAGAEMAVVVGPVKKVLHAILLRYNAEKSAHLSHSFSGYVAMCHRD